MAPQIDLASLKKVGTLQQRDKDHFILRFRLVGGDIGSDHLRAAADIARTYGQGEIHLTTRQGLEIPWIAGEFIEEARQFAEAAGLLMSVCGPRVRGVVACPGNSICPQGIIDTKTLAKKLDAAYFGVDAPHKFKMAVTGCPNNCAKPQENDLGVTGGILPKWQAADCSFCDLCIDVCPTQAISRVEDRYSFDESKCLFCTTCTSKCPSGSWVREKEGYLVSVGGTMGKVPRLATRITGLIQDQDLVLNIADRTLKFFQATGRKRERFAQTLDRYGVEAAKKEILNGLDHQTQG